MATDGNLKTEQSKAIAALLIEKDIESAAKKAGVGERTLHRWLKEDATFQAALKDAESQAIAEAVRRLAGTAKYAVSVLLNIMADTQLQPSVRLRACIAVLEQVVKLRQFTDIEERVAALEQATAEFTKTVA